MKYPRVTIIWDDACSRDAWHTVSEIDPTPKRCMTTGWLLKQTKEAVVVSHTVTEDGDTCCGITIPLKMAKIIRKAG